MAIVFTDTLASGSAIAAIWTPPPLDLGLAALAVGFKTSNYLLKPPTATQIWMDSLTTIVPLIIPQTQVIQTGVAAGSAMVQPIITPWSDNLSKPTTCMPPRPC